MLLKIFIRNAFRHKLRTALTVAGMLVALLSFGMLRTVVDAWYAGVEASSATRLVTRNAISLIFPLPMAYKERIRRVDGVTQVAAGNWFGAYYKEQKNFFANFAVQPGPYFDLYPEYLVPEDEMRDFQRDRKGAVAGVKLARRFGWEVGDTVNLTGTIYPGRWEFVIRGLYRGRTPAVDETQFMFHWEYLNQTMLRVMPSRADQAGFFIVGVEEPEAAPRVSREIDSLFENAVAQTLTETEKAFQMSFVAMTEAILTTIELVSLVIIVIILAVVANTMAMSVRERIGEYAVFKTLGFEGWRIVALVLGESLVITSLGGAAGLALTFPAARLFAALLGHYFPVFNVSSGTVWMGAAATLTVGVLAAILPAVRAVRVPIAEALRRIG